MVRLQHILLVSLVFALLNGFGWNVETSDAHPSGHSHKHIFSSLDDHHHGSETAKENKFYCPMHKHYSSMPCPHRHTQKEMAHPEQCKIGPECGGSSQKSLPGNPGTDHNRGLNDQTIPLDPPEITQAPFVRRMPYNSPQPDSPWHPPQSLQQQSQSV